MLILTLLLCLVPSTILLVGYGLLTRWYASLEGRVLFALIFTSFEQFLFGVLFLVWPHVFGVGAPLEWVRTAARVPIIPVMWGLVWVFIRAQRSGRSPIERRSRS